jgi:hypothetical protein
MEQGGSGDVSDMTDAREEIEQRLNFLLPQAERMLNERGDFYPYAAALDRLDDRRSTSTCAGALMSAQILMRRDSAARRRREVSDRSRRELRVERIALHQRAGAFQE